MTMTETLTPRSDALATRLTRRESQIRDLLVRGYNHKQIGRELGISHRTVEDHKYSLQRKMGVQNTIEMLWKVLGRD